MTGTLTASGRTALVLMALWPLTACGPTPVAIPPVSQDKPPAIRIANTPVGGSGQIDQESVTASGSVKVTEDTKVFIVASASNPGGVKQFNIKVIEGPNVLFNVETTATLDTNNQVPDSLTILGSDGAGHAGGKVAIGFTMTAHSNGIEKTSDPRSLVATATNFNGMTTSVTITYALWSPPPPPPRIDSLTASPNGGYINVGDSASLAWSTTNCGSGCQVSMKGMDGLNYGDLLSDFPHLPSTGSITVSPRRSTFTKYVLTATNSQGSDSKHVVVQLYCGPGGPACGGTPQGSVFYFKMTNSQSLVTPCFTLAIYAKDEAQAKQLAQAQNGGYTATSITQTEYLRGC